MTLTYIFFPVKIVIYKTAMSHNFPLFSVNALSLYGDRHTRRFPQFFWFYFRLHKNMVLPFQDVGNSVAIETFYFRLKRDMLRGIGKSEWLSACPQYNVQSLRYRVCHMPHVTCHTAFLNAKWIGVRVLILFGPRRRRKTKNKKNTD
jgi:hypothetical protein